MKRRKWQSFETRGKLGTVLEVFVPLLIFFGLIVLPRLLQQIGVFHRSH